MVTSCPASQDNNLPVQVNSLDARLATMAGQDEAASVAQELLRSQLATARAEAVAAEERSGVARAAHAAKSQECSRSGSVLTWPKHTDANVHCTMQWDADETCSRSQS